MKLAGALRFHAANHIAKDDQKALLIYQKVRGRRMGRSRHHAGGNLQNRRFGRGSRFWQMHQPVGIRCRKRKCASHARTGGFAATKPPQQGTGLDRQSGAKGILAVGGIYPVGTARVAWVVKPDKRLYPFQTRRIRNPACPQLEAVCQLGGEGKKGRLKTVAQFSDGLLPFR